MKKVLKTLLSISIVLSLIQIPSLMAIHPNNNFINDIHEIDNIGGAYLTFAGKFGGDINYKDLQKTTKLGVAGCAAGSLITKFNLHIKSNGKVKSFKGNSHILTKDMLQSLQALKKGDSFEFDHVKAKLPSGKTVKVVARKFMII